MNPENPPSKPDEIKSPQPVPDEVKAAPEEVQITLVENPIIDDEGNRDKRADILLRFSKSAQKIEPLHGKKFEAVFDNEEHIREFISNLSEQEFIELLNGINGIVRGKEKEEWKMDGRGVGIKGAFFMSPFLEDKPELLGKVLEAAKRMNEDERDLDDIAVLVASSINEIHPYANGNGRTSRFTYWVLTEKISDDQVQEKLREILLDSGRDIIDVNPGQIKLKIDNIINYRIGVNDKNKNPEHADRIITKKWLGRKDKFSFQESVKEETQNLITDLFKADRMNIFRAVFQFLENHSGKEKYIKKIPDHDFAGIVIDDLLKDLDQKDIEKIIQLYRDIKKKHVEILIDCIENPNKPEYETEYNRKKTTLKGIIEENIDRIEVRRQIDENSKNLREKQQLENK